MADNPKTPEARAFAKRLGLTIKAIRALSDGMTQAELAKLAGVSQSGTISRWEKGYTEMSAYDVSRVARALGVKPGQLFEPPFDVSAKIKLD